ncbi:uncharacterized protein TNIN_380361 [Trichonephila inaurata madagascariensis]|uniref:Uncharacterized protein n=1 Tax=Trichonephila inaurata madagascariensis TaxID=2747483 RepID=A0A8X7BX84_9ARAC|nr:uncharacterized protein TNIN_380361 [Trichonephila inaurata madagascariensis]
MEFYYNEMNPLVKENEPVVNIAHESKPTMYKISSSSHKILNEMDLNIEKYSRRSLTKLDSIDRSKRVCEEPKHRHNECSFQRYVNIALKTQIERGNQNKMAASNLSLMQFSNAYSNETPTEQNILGRSLNNEGKRFIEAEI